MAVRVCCADRTVTTSFSFSFALLAHPGRRLCGARGVLNVPLDQPKR